MFVQYISKMNNPIYQRYVDKKNMDHELLIVALNKMKNKEHDEKDPSSLDDDNLLPPPPFPSRLTSQSLTGLCYDGIESTITQMELDLDLIEGSVVGGKYQDYSEDDLLFIMKCRHNPLKRQIRDSKYDSAIFNDSLHQIERGEEGEGEQEDDANLTVEVYNDYDKNLSTVFGITRITYKETITFRKIDDRKPFGKQFKPEIKSVFRSLNGGGARTRASEEVPVNSHSPIINDIGLSGNEPFHIEDFSKEAVFLKPI